jgi:hypothetical protein
LLPGLGEAGCADEVTGAGAAVGAVAGLVGGSVETDCAYAVAATPASKPKPMTVDLSKLDIRRSPVDYCRLKLKMKQPPLAHK